LKQIFTIVTFILLLTTASFAQTNPAGGNGSVPRVKMVRFYPNPATSFINFEFQSADNLSNYSFRIYNFIGKRVLELNNVSPRTNINLSEFFRGVYIFQLTDRNGQIIESGKFQVAK
jgi:hypothetical protein